MSKRSLRKTLAKIEKRWKSACVDPNTFGFQIQEGTKWLPGLSDIEIETFSEEANLVLPRHFREYLSLANGTDKQLLDVRGGDGRPHQYGHGVFSFPKDLPEMAIQRSRVEEYYSVVEEVLDNSKLRFGEIKGVVPLFGHRSLVVQEDTESSVVISAMGQDIIIYGENIETYFKNEFLS